MSFEKAFYDIFIENISVTLKLMKIFSYLAFPLRFLCTPGGYAYHRLGTAVLRDCITAFERVGVGGEFRQRGKKESCVIQFFHQESNRLCTHAHKLYPYLIITGPPNIKVFKQFLKH